MNYIPRIVVPLLLVAVSVSCTRLWTKRFVLEDNTPKPTIGNWEIDPDCYAFVGRASDTAIVDWNQFNLSIDLWDWKAKKGGDVRDIHLDSAKVTFLPSRQEQRLWGRFVTYLSFPGDYEVRKTFSFRGLDFVGDPEFKSYSFEIPKCIDTVLVELMATLSQGVLTTQPAFGGKQERDFIEVDESAPVDTVRTQFKMYRSVTSQKTWKLFNDLNNDRRISTPPPF